MRIVLLLLASLSLIACSSQPQTPGSPPTGTATAQAQPPAATKTGMKSVSMTPNGVKIPIGYKLVVKNGQELYCRKETILGSRFPQTICLDENGLKELEARGQSVRDDLTRSEGKCVGDSCGGK